MRQCVLVHISRRKDVCWEKNNPIYIFHLRMFRGIIIDTLCNWCFDEYFTISFTLESLQMFGSACNVQNGKEVARNFLKDPSRERIYELKHWSNLEISAFKTCLNSFIDIVSPVAESCRSLNADKICLHYKNLLKIRILVIAYLVLFLSSHWG